MLTPLLILAVVCVYGLVIAICVAAKSPAEKAQDREPPASALLAGVAMLGAWLDGGGL